jgi:hypothetical protein
LLLFRFTDLLLPGPVVRNLLLSAALIPLTGCAEDGAPGSSSESTTTGVTGDRTCRRAHNRPPGCASDKSRCLAGQLDWLGWLEPAVLDWSRGIKAGLVDGPEPTLQAVATLLFSTLTTGGVDEQILSPSLQASADQSDEKSTEC